MVPLGSNLVQLLAEYEKEFIGAIKPLDGSFVVYPRGIWVSEMFAFCALCKHFGVEKIIESGIYLGQSTDIITSFLSDTNLYSIDKEIKQEVKSRYERRNGKWFLEGNGETWVSYIIDTSSRDLCLAVLLDGPKGDAALNLALRCLRGNNNVKFVAIHDVYSPSAARVLMDDTFCSKWYTDDPEFVERYKYMDEGKYDRWMDERGYGKKPYTLIRPEGTTKIQSYGPTLGFLFREDLIGKIEIS